MRRDDVDLVWDLQLGELVGVQSPSDRQTYGLGVVRWMKTAADQELDIGLEVIATRCQAGDVREVAKTSSYKAFVDETPDGQRLLDLALAVE